MALMPSRGEVWFADLDPTKGHEQAGLRPVLIVSTDVFNHGPADLVIAIPLTSTQRRFPYRVRIDPPEGGLRNPSYVLCDSVRSIAKERLKNRIGAASADSMETVSDYLRILMEL